MKSSYTLIIYRLNSDRDICIGERSSSDQEVEQSSTADVGVYRPKGPLPDIAKQFKDFIKELANELGYSVAELETMGYRCIQFDNRVELTFPNKEQASSFTQWLEAKKHPPLSKRLTRSSSKSQLDSEKVQEKRFNPIPTPFGTRN